MTVDNHHIDEAGWMGMLVLKGNFDISALYKPAIDTAAGKTVVYGNSGTGDMDFRELGTEESFSTEAVAHVSQKLPISPYATLIVGDVPKTFHVPARNTTVALWSQGQCSPGFDKMIEALVQLNRDPLPQKSNYASLVRERVFLPQGGKYATCLGYFSKHPRLILSTKNMQIYTWVVYYNGVYVFLWSTDPNYMDRVRSQLEPTKQNDLFALDVPLDTVSLLVIHPLFWVTKFNKVFTSIQNGSNKLTITSYFRNYLLRQSLTRPLQFDGDL